MEIIFGLIIIFLIFILIKFVISSASIFLKILWNGFIGIITLFIFNIFGNLIGMPIEITFLNAIVAGLLGMPGIVILLLLR